MAKSSVSELPLFPLGQVLFPGGRMALRIFEARYLDLVSRCVRESAGFGVVLIRSGADTYGAEMGHPEIHDVGTVARIVDFDQAEPGQLAIGIKGQGKFRLSATREQPDHLLVGEVEYLPEESACAVEGEFEGLTMLLREMMRRSSAGSERPAPEIDLTDARALGWRLAEMLPLPPAVRQSLLEMGSATERLSEIQRLVERAGRAAP